MLLKAAWLVGKECPKSLKRKDKEKALIGYTDQRFSPLSSWNKREIIGGVDEI